MSHTVRRVRLGHRADLVADQWRRFELEGHHVIVVSLDEEIIALDDTCSHESASLYEEGILDAEAREIECCRHGARFSLHDGSATSLPATEGLRRYPLAFEDDDVFIEFRS